MADISGLVSLGGILSSAVRAYEAKEQERVEEVRQLRAALDKEKEEQQERVDELRAALDEEKKERAKLQGQIDGLKRRKLLSFSVEDVAGVWFDTASNARITVSTAGDCSYDTGSSKKIIVDAGTLKLGGEYFLSQDDSARKQLIWEASGKPTLTWKYEMPGGSRQVVLTLDVMQVLEGRRCFDSELHQLVLQRWFSYHFSLLGCEVELRLGRHSKAADGKWVAGDKVLGVFLGLRRSTVKVGATPNSVDAIRCSVVFEFWDLKSEAWRFLARNIFRRYEAGTTAYGLFDAIPLSEFATMAVQQDRYSSRKTCKFRVTVTDIGLLELTNSQERIQPVQI